MAGEIDALNARLYDKLNNGVYRAGFALTQAAYDEAVAGVFEMLDELEARLTGDYLFGHRLTETDIRAFVTLIRFDAAYHGLFKTNRRRIADYPRLSAYHGAHPRPAGRGRDGGHGPHHPRLLFDQGAEPDRHPPRRPGSCRRAAGSGRVTLPSLFLAHGAPDKPFSPIPARDFGKPGERMKVLGKA